MYWLFVMSLQDGQEAYAIPNQEAVTVARVFVDEFVSRFGAPLQVHSDQGRNFESNVFKQMCNFFSIHKTRTTSFRPQANGMVERFNRTLLNMIAMYCNKNQKTKNLGTLTYHR